MARGIIGQWEVEEVELDEDELRQTVDLYESHGWTIERQTVADTSPGQDAPMTTVLFWRSMLNSELVE